MNQNNTISKKIISNVSDLILKYTNFPNVIINYIMNILYNETYEVYYKFKTNNNDYVVGFFYNNRRLHIVYNSGIIIRYNVTNNKFTILNHYNKIFFATKFIKNFIYIVSDFFNTSEAVYYDYGGV